MSKKNKEQMFGKIDNIDVLVSHDDDDVIDLLNEDDKQEMVDNEAKALEAMVRVLKHNKNAELDSPLEVTITKQKNKNPKKIKSNHSPETKIAEVDDLFEKDKDFYEKLNSTNILLDECYKIQDQVNSEFCRAQIEALTNFRRLENGKETYNHIDNNLIWSFNLDDIDNEISKRLYENKATVDSNIIKIDNIILKDFSDKPKYKKTKYSIPFQAKLKRFWFRLTKGPLYKRKKFENFKFKNLNSQKEENFKKIIEFKWMLFVCKWHNTRISFDTSNSTTNYLVQQIQSAYTSFNQGQKAITYQDLHPVKREKILKWLLNLKYIKILEIYLHSNIRNKMHNFVLDYVKNDLQFNTTSEELLPVNQFANKKGKKVNKPGKPFSVNRL